MMIRRATVAHLSTAVAFAIVVAPMAGLLVAALIFLSWMFAHDARAAEASSETAVALVSGWIFGAATLRALRPDVPLLATRSKHTGEYMGYRASRRVWVVLALASIAAFVCASLVRLAGFTMGS
jgi:hypothetical protein